MQGKNFYFKTVWSVGTVMTEKTDRSFSNGAPVDSVETEKSRVVLQELEAGWWILAVR